MTVPLSVGGASMWTPSPASRTTRCGPTRCGGCGTWPTCSTPRTFAGGCGAAALPPPPADPARRQPPPMLGATGWARCWRRRPQLNLRTAPALRRAATVPVSPCTPKASTCCIGRASQRPAGWRPRPPPSLRCCSPTKRRAS
ncbi:hypothetical protein BU14_0058s0019 [Porphyra umbilicalis]|uniref:Uncharacterized protein n=1 Tax=Porphyra umbilicalis TaxID=2786 RepID=A0A1X6PH75_PORUM|nr:hypothetical protein BU14_0058s0019 [Porphyra umbilicalis]|eukprot:OSX80108.1 hypothetical protein BU14_0058s0019 [Porphyra umbilicalis]